MDFRFGEGFALDCDFISGVSNAFSVVSFSTASGSTRFEAEIEADHFMKRRRARIRCNKEGRPVTVLGTSPSGSGVEVRRRPLRNTQ